MKFGNPLYRTRILRTRSNFIRFEDENTCPLILMDRNYYGPIYSSSDKTECGQQEKGIVNKLSDKL